MHTYRLGILAGDGIGPEIVRAARGVLDAAAKRVGNLTIVWVPLVMGLEAIDLYGAAMPDETKQALAGCHGWLLGPHDSASYPATERERRNPSGELRHHFDLYANIRPALGWPGVPAVAPQADLVIVRENTEGFYPDRNMSRGWGEMMPSPDMALSVRKITRHASERIARRAFEWAMRRRRKVTAIHKANSFHMTDGLFLEAVRHVAKEFPEIELDDLLVDASTAHIVKSPERFDVIVATNFYGDILSDMASELSGSLGLAGSMMASDTNCCAQAQHGSAPDIAGKNIANPTSMILSVAMLLQWMGGHHGRPALAEAGNEMERAVDKVLENPATRTRDIGGTIGCKKFGRAVAEAVAA